jgi:hypothetical protein
VPTSFAPPTVEPVPPGFFAVFSFARVRCAVSPPGEPPTDPWLFRLVTVADEYQPVEGARNALRRDLHATGVIS